jgi:diguanylate cyclase (GGDEF)-like protein/PAS domain S-box-containing protein
VKRPSRVAQTPPPRSQDSAADSDRRIGRRGRLAALGIVVILLGVSGFALWSSHATAFAARNAATATRLSDAYARAASAVAAEESLERKYRLEPGPADRATYNAAEANFVTALGDLQANGDADEHVFVAKVLAQQVDYLAAINSLFAQVDLGNTPAVLKIDSGKVDPTFGVIESEVAAESAAQHAVALHQLAHLQDLERLTSKLTPAVFGLGLLLAGLLAGVARGYRRLLRAERAGAIEYALRDPLTGLANRSLFADRTEAALDAATRSGATTALLLVDLDRFKEINDTFGHKYGDQLLALIGRRFAAAVRDGDTVARIGGDEFAILLPDVADLAAATAIAANLQQALETSFQVEGVELEVEASIGIVLSGEHGTDAATLLQHADVAMYVAKSRNVGVFVYSKEIDEYSPERLALLGDLRRALEMHEIVLHYQPKVSVASGEVVGVEALARWQHPTRGLLYPDSFIAVAEHTGLIGPFTSYVLNAALAQARIWAGQGSPMSVAVNLSGHNLLDEHLPTEVAELLATHGVPASLLELEVTESAIMLDPVRAGRLLQSLSDLGIRLSIDDFGAGYTSLSQLKTLPIDELKIDRSFVMAMASDARDALIVQSVIELGQNLGLNIVAEGVETAQALATLHRFDCDIAQGYFIARPAPAETFDAWLRARTNSAPLPIAVTPSRRASDAVFTERDFSEPTSPAAALRASEERFRALFTLAPIGITEARADGTIVAMNPHGCAMLGYNLDEVIGGSVTMFIDPDDRAEQARSLAALSDSDGYSARRIFRRKDGTAVTVLMNVAVVRQASGAVHRMVGMMVDISELAAAQQSLAANAIALTARESELRKSAAFQDAVLAATPDLIFVAESITNRNVWSSGNLAEFGYTARQLKGLGGNAINTFVHPDDQFKVREQNAAAQALPDGEVVRIRYRIRVQDDVYRWFGRSVTPFARDGAGGVTQILGITSDVTELVDVEQRLADAALHDPLTGLPNHTLLTDRLAKTLARSSRSGHQLAVVFCNIGGFRKVNEDGGREAGDAVLKATAGRLLSALRPEDTTARIGVDGFVIILEPSSRTWAGPDGAPIDVRAYAAEVAQRIETALTLPVDFGGRAYTVTVSIGLAIAQAGDDVEDVLAQADAAMCRAKILGKNCHEIADGVRRTESSRL